MKIAYFTNAYPKVSHSFIRRETVALEELGVEVVRISVRKTTELLPDPLDQAEAAKTLSLLGTPQAAWRVMMSVARSAVRSPRAFARAWFTAMELARGSSAGRLRHLIYLAEACSLAELLHAARIQHVHVHFGTNPAAVARIAKSLSDITYSLTVHGPDEFDAPAGTKLSEKIEHCEFVAGVSSFGRGQLMRWARLEDWAKVRVVRCGVDEQFLRSPIDRPPSGNNFVCVARLSGQKGLPLLLDAAALVKAHGRDFQLRLIGDGELRDQLEAKVRALQIQDNVSFLGWRTAEEIRDELANSRAFVLPSFAEGLPVVLMEAMALRRPVIATAIAGIPELVDAECGWLVPSGSAQHLAEAMIGALDLEPSRLLAMGEAGRMRVAEQHDASANARILMAEFRRLAHVE